MIFIRVTTNVLSKALNARRCNAHKRRGVLLLVTVCMLTLFLMLGTAYLVAASRARESANAIARKTLFNDQTNYRPETYLDNVLMKIVRGGMAPHALVAAVLPIRFESLLADKYGTFEDANGNTVLDTKMPTVTACSILVKIQMEI